MNEKEKKNKNADETLRIIKKILDYNKNAQRSFSAPSYADKGKSEPKDDKRKSEPKDGKRKSEVDKEIRTKSWKKALQREQN